MPKSRALCPTWSAAALAVLLSLSGAAAAAPAASSGVSKEAEAKKSEAFRLFAEGDFAGGIQAMRESHRLAPHPAALFNIAVGYDQWGDHCKDSLASFQDFFALCAGTCELLQVATRRHEKVEGQCTGRTILESVPSGALLQLDGEALGPSPIERKLLIGPHELVVSQPGYAKQTKSFDVQAGRDNRVRVELVADAPTATNTRPPADAIVYQSPRAGSDLRTWSYVAFGVGGAGAIMGVVFTAMTLSQLSDEEAARATPLPKAEILDIQGSAQTNAALAHVGFGVALAGAAAGVVLLVMDSDSGAEPSVSPVVGPGAVGLAGRF